MADNQVDDPAGTGDEDILPDLTGNDADVSDYPSTGAAGDEDELAQILASVERDGAAKGEYPNAGIDEENLTPTQKHGLRVATQKQAEIDQLKRELAERDMRIGKFSDIEARLARLTEAANRPVVVEKEEPKGSLGERILNDLGLDDLDIATGGKAALSKFADRLAGVIEERIKLRDEDDPDRALVRRARYVQSIAGASPAVARFLNNPANLARMTKAEAAYAGDAVDIGLIKQKAAMFDALSGSADEQLRGVSGGAGSPRTPAPRRATVPRGALGVGDGAPGSATGMRDRLRAKSTLDKAADLPDDQFAELYGRLEHEVREQEARMSR